MTCQQRFVKTLRDGGYRLTRQRKIILDTLHEVGPLASAEDVHEYVLRDNPSIDLSTVYRTLDLLLGLGFVMCVDRERGDRLYELTEPHGPHLHLVCRECGRIIPVESQRAQPLIDLIAREYGFSVDIESLSMSGLCGNCRHGVPDSGDNGNE